MFNFGYSQKDIKTNKDSESNLNLKFEQVDKNNQQLKEEIKELKETSNKNLSDVKSDLKETINTYVIIIGSVITIVGFLINFLGKSAIKKRVEEIISETAKEHTEKKILGVLNSKITDDLIEKTIKAKADAEIEKTLKLIEEKGHFAINEITEKGLEAINSLKSYPLNEINSSDSNLTDQEIQDNNIRQTANELFDLAYKSNDPRLQVELYLSVLNIEPNNIFALNNIGVSYNSLTKPEEALKYLNRAIELDSNYFLSLTNRAQSYNLIGEFDKALIDLDKSIRLNSFLDYSYSVKGNILTKQGKFKDAEIVLNKAIELNPNSGDAYFNRGYFYEERKEFSKSESDYKKAEAFGVVNKAMLYNNIAVLYRRTKQFDLAIQYLEKARKESPDFANIDGTLALIYADKGDDENFYKFLKVALEKGCKAWDYLADPGFDKYRDSKRLKLLLEPFQKKYFA